MTAGSGALARPAYRFGHAAPATGPRIQALALVVHEMMTNSAKYGALADSTGQVEVVWKLDRASIPDELAAAPVIQKPYTRETVEAALGRLK